MANLILSSIPWMGPRAHQFSATARAYYAGATTAARTQPTIAPTRSYAGAIRYYEPNEHARGESYRRGSGRQTPTVKPTSTAFFPNSDGQFVRHSRLPMLDPTRVCPPLAGTIRDHQAHTPTATATGCGVVALPDFPLSHPGYRRLGFFVP